MPEQNPFAPPQAEVSDVTARVEQAPPLWNPNAAASWSLLFSPILGAYLHMRNWQALGQPEKAATSKNWIIGVLAFFIVLMGLSLAAPQSKALDLLGRVGGFALLLGWYYSIGKSQQAYVLARFGKGYPRRGWLLPLAAAVGALIAFIVVVFVIALLTGAPIAEN